MDDGSVELTDPLEHSVGGRGGHLLRRGFHISMIILPWMYYWKGEQITDWWNDLTGLSMTRDMIASSLVFALIFAEMIRLKAGVTVYGQHDYEAGQVSALAWGAFSIGVACLMAPKVGHLGAAIGAPLIVSLALGDPLLGEMRRKNIDERNVLIIGTFAVAAIWFSGFLWLETRWWLIPIFAPLCVIAEKPRLRWIDDNATMILIPLGLAVLLGPWL